MKMGARLYFLYHYIVGTDALFLWLLRLGPLSAPRFRAVLEEIRNKLVKTGNLLYNI